MDTITIEAMGENRNTLVASKCGNWGQVNRLYSVSEEAHE